MPVFSFEDCLLKHFIRRDVWLPYCKERLRKVRAANPRRPRRLRYFTFCAVGALDVLLLDRERVIRRSSSGEFDTVVFFDKDADAVIETQKRIRGAKGFPGDFTQVVQQAAGAIENFALQVLENESDTREVRQKQIQRAQLADFVSAFPFDVVNLDVERYIFKPSEELPGVLTNVIRRVMNWQKREGKDSIGKSFYVDEFTLMFTTKIGPTNLPNSYVSYLRDQCIVSNLAEFSELNDPFLRKSKGRDPGAFFNEDFDGAFKLAVPKSLIDLAFEEDWYIDDTKGVQVYQFDRDYEGGKYRMLHMAMVVSRQRPPKEARAPGQRDQSALTARKNTIIKLFNSDAVAVEPLVENGMQGSLQADLNRLFKHRERYYKPSTE